MCEAQSAIHETLGTLDMSNLNNHIVNRHLSTDPKCSCGYSKETAEHYLLHCPNYFNIRARTILTLPSSRTNIRTLLYGIIDLRLPENKHARAHTNDHTPRFPLSHSLSPLIITSEPVKTSAAKQTNKKLKQKFSTSSNACERVKVAQSRQK